MRTTHLFALSLASGLAAQTFVVDAGNGPGTHFTDLGAAAAAVPSGALLLVRPGLYTPPVAIHQKSLTVLGGPGVRVGGGGISVTALLPGQCVVLRGVEGAANGQGNGVPVACSACQGAILLDRVTGFSSTFLTVDQCAQVHVTNCSFTGTATAPPARVAASDVTFVDTVLGSFVSMPALRQVGGRVHLVGTTAVGAAQLLFLPPAPAVELQGGQFRCDGGSSLQGGGGTAPAIVGAATARLDPSTQLVGGAPLISPTVAATFVDLPAVQTTGGDLGGTVSATMRGAAGQFGLLAIGFPGEPVLLPGWVDPLSIFHGTTLAADFLQPSLTASFLVPNVPAFAGLALGWQGLTLAANGTAQLSNGAWLVLR